MGENIFQTTDWTINCWKLNPSTKKYFKRRKREINDLNWGKQVKNNAFECKKKVLESELSSKLRGMVILRQNQLFFCLESEFYLLQNIFETAETIFNCSSSFPSSKKYFEKRYCGKISKNKADLIIYHIYRHKTYKHSICCKNVITLQHDRNRFHSFK